MLRRISVISLLVITVVLTCYSGLWFYTAGVLKKKVERVAADISRNVSRNGGEFYYSYSRVGGFPLRFDVHFHDLRLSHSDWPLQKLTTEDRLTIRVPVFGSTLSLLLPPRFEAMFEAQHALNHLHFFYQSPPVLSLQGTKSIFSPVIMNDLYSHLLEVVSNVNVLNYMDEGLLINSAHDMRNIAAFESNFLGIILHPRKESQETEVFWESRSINMDSLMRKDRPLGEIDISFDLSFSGDFSLQEQNTDTSLVIRRISLANGGNEAKLYGSLQTDLQEELPYGDLYLQATNYEKLLEQFFYAKNQLSIYLEDPDLYMRSSDINRTKRFIRRVVGKKEGDIQFDIGRKRGKDLVLGEFSLPSLLKLYKRY
jgi:hypothetical protein